MTTTGVPDWPDNLRPQDIEIDGAWARMTGPKPFASGAPQDWAADAGTWKLTLVNIGLYDDRGRIHSLRSMLAGLMPPYDVVNVPFYDNIRSPLARLGLYRGGAGTFGDGATFSDGSSFDTGRPACALSADAAVRDTLINVQSQGTIKIWSGDIVGFGTTGDAKSAHMVGLATDNDDGTQTLSRLWPPLRAGFTYASGLAVEIENPMVACRMPNPPPLRLQFGRKGQISLDFVEIAR